MKFSNSEFEAQENKFVEGMKDLFMFLQFIHSNFSCVDYQCDRRLLAFLSN